MLNVLHKIKNIFSKNSKEIVIDSKTKAVYWTENGKNYHTDRNCISLSRSKNVKEGSIADCPKEVLCCNCGQKK